MKKKALKKYPINQSPFFKCSSHGRLSKILGCEKDTLYRILSKADSNYFFGTLASGRDIEVPKHQMRRIHSRIFSLLSRIDPPDYLNSGVRGRSNVINAKAHLGHNKVGSLDIKDYYQSTSYEMVYKCFRKLFSCADDVSKTLASLCCVKGHLPTGSPISQVLAFLVNKAVFDKIQRYCHKRKITFTLYVDDLTLSGETVSNEVLKHIAFIIKSDRGYDSHKFRLYGIDKQKPITGLVVNGDTLEVKNKHRLIISDLLKKVDYYSKDNIDKDRKEKFFQVLIGHLFSAGQANGRYYQKGKEMVAYRDSLNINAINK